MGRNRQPASPEAYPAVFLAAIRNGGGVFYASDLIWTPGSTAKRFRLLLAQLRTLPHHDLYRRAMARWHVESSPRAVVVRLNQPTYQPALMARPLIELALAIGVNPNNAPPPNLP